MMRFLTRLKAALLLLVFWRKRETPHDEAEPQPSPPAPAPAHDEAPIAATAAQPSPAQAPAPSAPDMIPLLAMDIVPPPIPRTETPPADVIITENVYYARGPKRDADVWAPGYVPPKHTRKPRDPDAPKREKRTVLHVEQPDDDHDDDDRWHFGRADVEEGGTFYFRGALLNDLDVYFQVLARMKGAHKDAYDFYSKVGGAIIPRRGSVNVGELAPLWKDPKTRPGFAAAAFALCMEDFDDPKRPVIYPRFEFVQKMHIPPTHVEPTHDEDVYEVTSYFDHRKQRRKTPKWIRKHGFITHFHVAVDMHGNVRSLRHLQTKYIRIPHKTKHLDSKGHKRPIPHERYGVDRFQQQLWDYPPMLVDWYDDHKHNRGNLTVSEWGARQFMLIANLGNSDESGVRIEVTDKDSNTACFGIDMKRVAYFFKDRDVVLTPKGSRARIFHVVRPHVRTLKSGKEVAYRMHFRGLRTFQWAGYQVHITVPGLHHKPVFDLGLEVSDREAAIAIGQRDSGISMGKYGSAVRHIVHGEMRKAMDLMKSKDRP